MNENAGTTKLMTLQCGKLDELRLGLHSDSIAVRFGAKSSSIALVDCADEEKVLVFQITYTETGHQSMCIDFLVSGEKKEQIKRVLVNQLVPEFTEKLAEFASRAQQINFAAEVSKSGILLFHLADSFENILYVDDEDCVSVEMTAGAGSRAPTAQQLALIDSSGIGSRITLLSFDGATSGETKGQKSSTRPLDHSAHKTLVDSRRSLLNYLVSDAETACELANYEGDSTEDSLAHVLHNARFSDKSDKFQASIAAIVEPALAEYAAIVKENFPLSQDSETDVFISDCLFNSQFCRRVFLRDHLRLNGTKCKTIRFVKDHGVLGFIGALLTSS